MPSVVQQPTKLKLLRLGCKFMDELLFGGSLITRRVSEELQSAPRLHARVTIAWHVRGRG